MSRKPWIQARNPNVFVILCSQCGQHHDRRIACGTLGKSVPKS